MTESTALTLAEREEQAIAAFNEGNNPFLAHSDHEGVPDGTFGRMNGNTGQYIIDNNEVEPGFDAAMDIWNARLQWLGFDTENKPHRGPEVLIRDGLILPEPDKSNPDVRWNKQVVVPIVMMAEGTKVVYSSKADKPTRPIQRLIKQYGGLVARNRAAGGKGFKLPIVNMGSAGFEMYVNEDGRKVKVRKYREDFKIVEWMEPSDVWDRVSAPEDGLVAAAASENGDDAIDVTGTVEIIEPVKATAAPASTEVRPAPARPASPTAGSKFRK